MGNLVVGLVPNHVCTLVNNGNIKFLIDIVDTGDSYEIWHYYRGSVAKDLMLTLPKTGFERSTHAFNEVVSTIEKKLADNATHGKPTIVSHVRKDEDFDLKGYMQNLREYYQISSHLAEIDPEHFGED